MPEGLILIVEDNEKNLKLVRDVLEFNGYETLAARNAAEAVSGLENPRVTLGCRAATEGVAFTVTDTGPGVPPGEREAIFRPFHTTKPAGSGVGLALVRQIAHAHHGAVMFDGATGGGRFVLTLPAG